ncbi:MAG: siderophore-interacting protein [Legionella sp.]|nr:siderophore-interacting protein [Legionella sp.]
MTATKLSLEKIRHPAKMRMLTVARTRWVTPYLLSIVLTGEELEGFTSLSFNDHVKLFFPEPGQSKPRLPHFNPNGSLNTSGLGNTAIRDFTPRNYNKDKNELEIQFFIHADDVGEHGPAARWAINAKPGDLIGVGGPKGSLIIPAELEWFLMLGDETALPAISRRLEELPATAVVTVMVETACIQAPVHFKTQAKLNTHWVDKNSHTLFQSFSEWALPKGDGFIWAAGEFSSLKPIYNQLVQANTLDKSRFKISSYWKKGESNVHGTFGKE